MSKHSQYFQHSQRSFRRFVLPCVLGALSVVASFSGCDTTEESRVANKGDIRNIMNALTLAQGDPDVVAELFVEGAVPGREWFEFIENKLIETADIVLGKNEATVTFSVETYTGDIEADCEWKLVHQDGQWLISDAPVSVP